MKIEIRDLRPNPYRNIRYFFRTATPVTRRLFRSHLGRTKKMLEELNHGSTGEFVVPHLDDGGRRIGIKLAIPTRDLDGVLQNLNRRKSMALGHKASFERGVRVARAKNLVPPDQIPLLD